MAYKGNDIVTQARTCLGKSYGTWYAGHYMDCTGLVVYSCQKAGLNVSRSKMGGGCKQHWEYFNKSSHVGNVLFKSSSHMTHGTGKKITKSQVKAGDLLYKFNYDNSGNSHVVIATNSSGGTIDASGGAGVVREKSSYDWAFQDVDLWVRMYEDGATSTTETEPAIPTVDDGGSSPVITTVDTDTGDVTSTISYDYSYLLAGGLPLTNVDVYKGTMETMLKQIQSSQSYLVNGTYLAGSSSGFIYDLTHGGSFRFILPEISEEFSANYETISIPGRSSEVHSYNNTASQTRSISLDLMAGTGLYISTDPVGDMQKDIAFLKSLLYPDYSSSVVRPPAMVLAYLGPSSIIKGVITTLSVNYKKPYTVAGIPMRAEITIGITQASDDPADYIDMRQRKTVSY